MYRLDGERTIRLEATTETVNHDPDKSQKALHRRLEKAEAAFSAQVGANVKSEARPSC